MTAQRKRRGMMLILERRVGESIMVGDDIKIIIVSEKYGKVKIGIDAPDDIDIWREEIYEKIQKEQKG